jgi:hypothetical protein
LVISKEEGEMRKPKTYRQKLILENDRLFREIIRARDKVCQKTGKTTNLQVAHFWTRKGLRTRWDEENACLLNAGVHLYWAHIDRRQFEEFWRRRLGQEKFDALEIRARYVAQVKEMDLEFIKYNLKQKLSALLERLGR